jgi:putative N6-adenine-specific DNA methylase
MQEFTAIALCAVGAEKVVSNELKKLAPRAAENAAKSSVTGYTVLESGFGKVRFTTDLPGLYRALLSLRAADRLLLEAGIFPAGDFDALFEGARNIAWENLIPRGMGLTVGKVRTNRSTLKAETTIQAMVHKAAAERLCNRYGISRLPEAVKHEGSPPARASGGTGPGLRGPAQAELRVYLEKDQASVLLDISGAPLFKRGYRREGGPAPLRESTAAAIILLSGWRRKFPFYDPFCGSGTIVIEAAMYAWDLAPGLGRNFTLSELAIGNRKTEEALRRELAEKADYSRTIRIHGSDADEKAAALAAANLRWALALPGRMLGVAKDATTLPPGISIEALAMDKAKAPVSPPGETQDAGFLITNPPYGRRLGDPAEAEQRYREMAVLGKSFPGWKLALICDHSGFESHFGKKADSCRQLKSGAVDAYLYQYEKL